MSEQAEASYDDVKALVREHFGDHPSPCRLLAIAAALLRQVHSSDTIEVGEIHDMARRLEELSGSSESEPEVTLG